MPRHRGAAFIVVMAAVYLGAMFLLTHVPADGSPQAGGMDKLFHALLYSGLTLLLLTATSLFRRVGAATALVVALLVAVYGAVDEWTQSFIPSRTADFWDWLADVVGAGIGAGMFFVGKQLLRRRPRKAD